MREYVFLGVSKFVRKSDGKEFYRAFFYGDDPFGKTDGYMSFDVMIEEFEYDYLKTLKPLDPVILSMKMANYRWFLIKIQEE